MLGEMKKDFIVYARMLDRPYEEYKIDDLATAYCLAVDAGDELNKSIYISALILRFWYQINKMFMANPTLGYTREDFLDVIIDGIYKACEPRYRAWMNPEKKVNAQQCLNMCIQTKLRERYYFANLDKHRANQNTLSLELPLNNDPGDGTPLIDTLQSEEVVDYGDESLSIVQEYLNQNKIIEAIILDTIASSETYRRTKQVVKEYDSDGNMISKHTEYSTEFWPYKLVQCVSQLPEDYVKYFKRKYKVATVKLDVALAAIRKANNQKIYRMLDATLADARARFA
jgi:hypothetical protein